MKRRKYRSPAERAALLALHPIDREKVTDALRDLQRVERQIARWVSRQKRARSALLRLRRKLAFYINGTRNLVSDDVACDRRTSKTILEMVSTMGEVLS